MTRSLLALFALTAPLLADDAPWSTFHGNVRRTGNTDNVAPPAKPEVLWVLKSSENYVASPVPNGADVLFSGLGALNSAVFHSVPVSPKDPKAVKPTWSKGPPLLRLP